MTPLPWAGKPLTVWRLDRKKYEKTWDSGEGARLHGGRWNPPGRRAVYCSADPGTAILELAVHIGFDLLDVTQHVLTAAIIEDHSMVHVVYPGMVPNANWLRPGSPSAGQQRFGDSVLERYPFVSIPSTASSHSWNIMFDPDKAREVYALHLQEDFSLDTRLNPPRR